MWEKVTPLLGRNAEFDDRGRMLSIPNQIHHTICKWHEIAFMGKHRATLETLKSIQKRSDQPERLEKLFELLRENLGYSVFQSVERAKLGLSEHNEVPIAHTKLDIHESMSRDEFSEITAKQTTAIQRCVDDLLSTAKMGVDQIDSVFMTGGTSLIPHVRQVFIDRFGESKLRGGNTFTSVADGLGLSSPIFFKGIPSAPEGEEKKIGADTKERVL
jgi:hypothetical chaperone protein